MQLVHDFIIQPCWYEWSTLSILNLKKMYLINKHYNWDFWKWFKFFFRTLQLKNIKNISYKLINVTIEIGFLSFLKWLLKWTQFYFKQIIWYILQKRDLNNIDSIQVKYHILKENYIINKALHLFYGHKAESL